jgi:hypothetical protein
MHVCPNETDTTLTAVKGTEILPYTTAWVAEIESNHLGSCSCDQPSEFPSATSQFEHHLPLQGD